MDRTPVTSSNIESIGYDPETMVLEVKFKNGGVYQYLDCPQDLHEAMIKAKSIGGFFAGAVRPRLKWIRIEEQEKEKCPEKKESESTST